MKKGHKLSYMITNQASHLYLYSFFAALIISPTSTLTTEYFRPSSPRNIISKPVENEISVLPQAEMEPEHDKEDETLLLDLVSHLKEAGNNLNRDIDTPRINYALSRPKEDGKQSKSPYRRYKSYQSKKETPTFVHGQTNAELVPNNYKNTKKHTLFIAPRVG